MRDGPLEEARQCWNLLAEDWRVQVGDDGDSNRRLNSDPVHETHQQHPDPAHGVLPGD